jgi:hypothetical protein
MAAPVNFSLHVVSRRTLLKELIKERARLDLDKNSFESKGKNLISIIGSTIFQRDSWEELSKNRLFNYYKTSRLFYMSRYLATIRIHIMY